MKFKKLLAVGISAMLAASYVYADPDSSSLDQDQFADNSAASSGALQQQQTPTSGLDAPNVGGMPDSTLPSSGDMSASNNATPPSATDNTMGTNDDMSADTATGDDDY